MPGNHIRRYAAKPPPLRMTGQHSTELETPEAGKLSFVPGFDKCHPPPSKFERTRGWALSDRIGQQALRIHVAWLPSGCQMIATRS